MGFIDINKINEMFPKAELDPVELDRKLKSGETLQSLDPESTAVESYLKVTGKEGALATLDVYSDGSYTFSSLEPTEGKASAAAAATSRYTAFKDNGSWQTSYTLELNASKEIVSVGTSSSCNLRIGIVNGFTGLNGYRPERLTNRTAKCKFELVSLNSDPNLGTATGFSYTYFYHWVTTTSSNVKEEYKAY